MLRLSLCTSVALITLSTRGERLEALYLEGAELGATHTRTFAIEMGELSVTVNGMDLPPEALEEIGTRMPPTRKKRSLRTRDVVLAVSDGQPTRVRRVFEELREHSLEKGEEQEKTGPLEGRTLVISAQDGEYAELEDDKEELDELFLADHRLTYDSDLLLPVGPVAVGDRWALSDEAVRRFVDLDGGPVLFKPDEDEEHDFFQELVKKGSRITGKVEFLEIEEREGLSCAVLAFTIELDAELDDLSVMGIEPQEGMGEPSGVIKIQLGRTGKLWQGTEGRPVAMEQTLEGTIDIQVEMSLPVQGHDMQMKMDITASLEGDESSTWTKLE